MNNPLNDCYSPHTGEHIDGAKPAPWMGRAGVVCPAYDRRTQGAFFVNETWEVRDFLPTVSVPQSVSNAQGTAALIQMGLMTQVEAFVDSIVDPTEKALALVALNKTTNWLRTSPFLNAATAAIGLTDAELDGLFITAAAIQL